MLSMDRISDSYCNGNQIMKIHDRLTIDALYPGYLAACARREFDAALIAQQAAIADMGAVARQLRMAAAMKSQQAFWKSRGLL